MFGVLKPGRFVYVGRICHVSLNVCIKVKKRKKDKKKSKINPPIVSLVGHGRVETESQDGTLDRCLDLLPVAISVSSLN